MSEQLSDERVAAIQHEAVGQIVGDEPGQYWLAMWEIAALAREVLELRGIIRLRDAVLDLYPAPDLTGPRPYPIKLDP